MPKFPEITLVEALGSADTENKVSVNAEYPPGSRRDFQCLSHLCVPFP